MFNQSRMAGFATMLGAMLLTVAITLGCFMIRGFVPPFLLIVLPAMIGVGLLVAGLLHKKDNGWTRQIFPERKA
jgi:hypothetical protein